MDDFPNSLHSRGSVYYAVQGGSNLILSFWMNSYWSECDHSNESYWAVSFSGTVYYFVQDGSNFSVCELNPNVWPFKWKLHWTIRSCGAVYYAGQSVPRFEYVDEMLKCAHSNESYWVVHSCGIFYYTVQGVSNFSVLSGWSKARPSEKSFLNGAVCFALQRGPNIWVGGWNPKMRTSE